MRSIDADKPEPKLAVDLKLRRSYEKDVPRIIWDCETDFADYQTSNTKENQSLAKMRPDVRRVSLFSAICHAAVAKKSGRGCEIGPGFGYLLFPLAEFLPSISWHAVEHPGRGYAASEKYINKFKKYKCTLAYADITRERLPFPDGYFSVVTFSEVLEHLPVESVGFIMAELSRILEPGGVLVASSPNQASFESRLRLLQGKSILDLPFELDYAPGIFGHIRLYTPSEFSAIGARFGLSTCYYTAESNSAMFRGRSALSPRRLIHRAFELAEQVFPPMRVMGDTWYMCLVKSSSGAPNN